MTRGDALRWLARPLLAIVWAFVAWGNLILAVTLWHVLSDGLRPALALLTPGRDDSLWAWLNLLSAALALFVWAVVAGVQLWSRRPPRAPGEPGP